MPSSSEPNPGPAARQHEPGPFRARWRAARRRLQPLGAISQGNRLELLSQGDRFVEQLIEAIGAARERVLLVTYILRPDRVGRAVLEELADAAGRGVRVDLRFDAVGSGEVACPELDALRRLGGVVRAFNPVWTWSPRIARKLVRDHRKVSVVDGRVGFCGGMNLSEDYAGARFGAEVFRDTHLRVEGPAARDLEALFFEETRLGEQGPAATSRARPARVPPDAAGEGRGAWVQVLESNRWRGRRAIQRSLRHALGRASERAWLTTPYFVPPRKLRRGLLKAAERGVDVRLLTAGPSDVPLVRLIGRYLYARLLRGGVRIFELQGSTLHAKTAVFDGAYSSVGSFNLDVLSDRYNHEVNLGVLDGRLARALEADFERDLASAVEITPNALGRAGLLERSLGWVGYRLSKLF